MLSEADKFLVWYAENQNEIKRALRKNITFDEELFEDILSDSLIKVYEKIKTGTEVKSYKDYLFISAKWNFINEQNKLRKRQKQHDRDFLSYGDIEDEINIRDKRVTAINTLYKYIADYIEDYFPSNEVDLFIIYMKLKSESSSMSYQKMSDITGQPVSYITKTIKKIKEFVNQNEDIITKKNNLLDECLVSY